MVWGGAPERVTRDSLVAAAMTRRIVLLGAPGGSGKTTAADQIVAAWEAAPVRLRFAEPTDSVGAAGALVRAVRRAGLGDLAGALRDEVAADPAGAFDALVGLLRERDVAVALLLDDVHRLADATQRAIAEALAELPAPARVVVAGRDLGALATLGERDDAIGFDAEHLRLDADEIRALLGPESPATLVAEVLEATTGWCAAVGVVRQRLARDPGWSPSGAGGRALLDELVAELTGEVPTFAALAPLPLVDPEVAHLVGGDGVFDAARRAGLVVEQPGGWWVVPDPVREAVTAGAPLPDATLRAVAEHYHRRGELSAAVALLRTGPGAILAAFLGARHWLDLEALGVPEVLATVDALEDDALAAAPTLLLHTAFAVELRAPDRRADLLDRLRRLASDERLTRAADAETARDLVSAARLDEGRALAEQVLALAGPEEGITRARALSNLARIAIIACTAEGFAHGADAYAEAAQLFRAAGETRWLAETLARRGYTALYMGGAVVEGEAELRAALALLPTGDYSRSFWLTNHSDVLDYLGRVGEAEAAAREALEIGRRRADASIEGMAWWSLSWVAAHRGDLDAFRDAIAAFERVAGRWIRPGQLVEYLGSTAELFAQLGDEDACRAYIARGRDAAAAADYPVPIDLAEARLLAFVGDPDDAAARLATLDSGEALVPSNRPTRRILHALAEARRGNVERALAIRAEAEADAAALGVPDLLARYAGRTLALIDELTRPAGAPLPEPDERTAPGWDVRLLGDFSVARAGERCTPPPGHPSTVVKLLALNGVMTVDAAIDTLWPDSDLTTGRSRLRNLLNRIKQRSGEVVVRAGDTLQLHPTATCDLTVFEARAAAALSAGPDERVGLARGALALYTGELLPGDVYDDWTIGPRERAKRRYLALADVVADDAIARGDSEEAIRLLDLAIAAEPLDEARYVRMCSVLVAQGRVGTAREVAARAVAVLDEIGEVADATLRDLARA